MKSEKKKSQIGDLATYKFQINQIYLIRFSVYCLSIDTIYHLGRVELQLQIFDCLLEICGKTNLFSYVTFPTKANSNNIHCTLAKS